MKSIQDIKWDHTEKWTCQSCFGEWNIKTDSWGNYDLTFKPFAGWDGSGELKVKSFLNAAAAKTEVMQEDFNMELEYKKYCDRHMKSLGRLGKTTNDHKPWERESFEINVSWA